MLSLKNFLTESSINRIKNPEAIIMDNYKKNKYIDDILYAWAIADDLEWKKTSDSKILNYISDRDDLDKDEGIYYLDLIHAVMQMGKDVSKSYIENNWSKELKSLCTPW